MFKRIIKWFSRDDCQRRADAYIASKNPQTPGEVDYWTRRYEQMLAATRFM